MSPILAEIRYVEEYLKNIWLFLLDQSQALFINLENIKRLIWLWSSWMIWAGELSSFCLKKLDMAKTEAVVQRCSAKKENTCALGLQLY